MIYESRIYESMIYERMIHDEDIVAALFVRKSKNESRSQDVQSWVSM